MITTDKVHQTVESAVKSTIYGHGRGWVFTPKHFLGVGSPTAVRFVLFKLQKEKFIRRLSQGIYDYPGHHEVLGILSPNVDAVAKALCEKYGLKVQPSGAYAANLIGLSEQVPGRVVFLTDGASKKIKVGKIEISFRHTTLRNMFAVGSREALVIQAFRHIQKKHVDQTVLERTKRFLKGSSRKEFEKNIRHAPEWIRKTLSDLMEKEL